MTLGSGVAIDKWKLDWTDPDTSVGLLVLDGFLIALPPLLFEDKLHSPLGVFEDGR